MGRRRYTANRKSQEPIPSSKVIDGETYYLVASRRNHGQALHLSKAIQKRGDFAQVIEVQRGRKKFHCVYSRKGKGTLKHQAKVSILKKMRILDDEDKDENND